MLANLRYYLLAALVLVPTACGLECAVCLPSDTSASINRKIRNLFNNTKLIRCDGLNNSSVQFFMKTCPKNHLSCHVQKTEKWTARTCSKIAADQCQEANNVEYCYCTSNNCNVPNNLITESEQTTESFVIYNQTKEKVNVTRKQYSNLTSTACETSYHFSLLIYLTLLLYNL